MNVIHKFSEFGLPFLGKKGKTKPKLARSEICVPPQHKHSYEKLSRYVDFANFVKNRWSDPCRNFLFHLTVDVNGTCVINLYHLIR